MQQFYPHPYQQAAIDAILAKPGVALWMEMGLGKTVVTLTAIDQLLYDRLEVSRQMEAFTAPAHFHRAGHREAATCRAGRPSGRVHHQPGKHPVAGAHAGPEMGFRHGGSG